jgi:uncharacterized membrane protein
MLVEPPNDFVTVRLPFTFSGPPLRVTVLLCVLEDVNDPLTVKLSVMLITVVELVALAIITEVGQGTLFDVMTAPVAVIAKLDDPVNAIPDVIVRVPPLIPS